ncbi:MAG TPA: sigma-70 family RNA polymerase sigma factor, partial [Methylomirabilota bacterium]|nr:sigma-70 family RNA polymerase sigma factor [Methylomirabilota bacterium]
MHETDDVELLRQYAEEQSDAAFEALVKRHINLVYSAALRHVDNPSYAEEITQAVFIILARKARGLRPGIILSGWLYQTARLTAANFRRTEVRRLHREKEAHMQSVLTDDQSDAWLQIAPVLEQAVGGLNDKERNAIVLRFFEKKSLSEVGHAFGTSEDAAKMRVNRALEKLRKFFVKRGITLSTTVLAGAVSAHSVQAAPVELASAVATAAKASTVAVSTLTLVKGTLKLMAWAKAKMAIAISAVVLIGGSTSTIALMKWEAYKAHRDSWRAPGLKSEQVEAAVPQVRILPTKFSPPPGNLAASVTNEKWGGIGVGVPEMIFAAYNWRPARIVFPDGEPQEKYDFMANLRQGSVQALQRELR